MKCVPLVLLVGCAAALEGCGNAVACGQGTILVGAQCVPASTDLGAASPDDAAANDGTPVDAQPSPDLGPPCSQAPTCNFLSATDPAAATLRDTQSSRSEAGYYEVCLKNGAAQTTWHATTLCDFSEQCKAEAGRFSCVSCGDIGRRTATRTVDGMVVEDCAGCLCEAWQVPYVGNCYTETATYGEPWIDAVWQSGTDVLRFAITKSGRVIPIGFVNDVVQARPATIFQMNIAPGGTVELGLVVDDMHTDSFHQVHAWHLEAHTVGHCSM
jgi:hypothetical protein